MNKTLITTLKIFATAGFAGMLACIVFDFSNRLTLICCVVATVCSYIIFFSKKKNKDTKS